MEYLDDFIGTYKKLTPDAAAERYKSPFLVQREKFVEHNAPAVSTLQVDVDRMKDAIRDSAKEERRMLIPLAEKSYSVGRTDESDITLSHISMSKKHATLIRESDDPVTFSITDLGSTNGTFVGDDELKENQAQTLNNGDIVSFGSLEFRAFIFSRLACVRSRSAVTSGSAASRMFCTAWRCVSSSPKRSAIFSEKWPGAPKPPPDSAKTVDPTEDVINMSMIAAIRWFIWLLLKTLPARARESA